MSEFPFQNPDLELEERVNDLISRMTLDEKASQTLHEAPAIERLGVPEYNWWNEGLHGVGRAGLATVFPQSIALAATFNEDLMHRVATVISDEARAKHHQAVKQNNRGIYFGLTYWSPNINIFRDPRWGRGQETYGEDPYLTSRMGVAFVKGLQGDDEKYFKLVGTPKHYAVHSGPENLRHEFDVRPSPRDLRETYLRAFKACIQEAKAYSIMGAYNRFNGEACCASKVLLTDILRDEWGFEGYVVSDCGALGDIHNHHKLTGTPAESAALAMKNGCDLDCGKDAFTFLADAVQSGLLDEATLDNSLRRLFRARFKLGMFDPEERVKYAAIPPEIVNCPEHRELARQAARESFVLLKNDGLLPLRKDIANIAVIGPGAASLAPVVGNYFGLPSPFITPLEGIVRAISVGSQVQYAEGCGWVGSNKDGFGRALWYGREADVIVAVMGFTAEMEGEEGDVANSDGGGDRVSIELPKIQRELLRELKELGKPMILVLTGGSPIALGWENDNMNAMLMAWYPGEEGGNALADVIFGDYNPAGRLPVTFVKSVEQLPPFDDYSMRGRTYRFLEDEPLFRFGFGLSYTTFEYLTLKLSQREIAPDESVEVSVAVRNAGEQGGDEVVQLYVSRRASSVPVPLRQLEGCRRVFLKAGETQVVTFLLQSSQLWVYDDNGKPFVEAGEIAISVGGGQPDDANCVTMTLTVK